MAESDNLDNAKECGIQAGSLDEYAEYFECFLKIADCLPKIIVCGVDNEMPRIVVCEGLKQKPPVNTIEETKKVLQEIQKQVAEMVQVLQVNTVLREEINHIEGDCPVIKLKEVMKRITGDNPEEKQQNKCPGMKSTPAFDGCYSGYSSKTEIRSSHSKSYQCSEVSKCSITESVQVCCASSLKQQLVCGQCCCSTSNLRQFQTSMNDSCRVQCLSRENEDLTDDDIRALIEKCLGPPPCNTCEAEKFKNIVEDLAMEADCKFAHTEHKIYDIIVPPGFKDKQGWGGDHQIEPPVLPDQHFVCNTQKYAETVEELKRELSKLDCLTEVYLGGQNMQKKKYDAMECVSESCVSTANYINNKIASLEQELKYLRTCLDRSRKEREELEIKQNLLGCMQPVCYQY